MQENEPFDTGTHPETLKNQNIDKTFVIIKIFSIFFNSDVNYLKINLLLNFMNLKLRFLSINHQIFFPKSTDTILV